MDEINFSDKASGTSRSGKGPLYPLAVPDRQVVLVAPWAKQCNSMSAQTHRAAALWPLAGS